MKKQEFKHGTIYLGDCLEVMPQAIEENSIDMVLADLPYGITACPWDKIIPFDKLWIEYKRIGKERTSFVFTASQPFTTDLINSNRKWFRYEWIWQKTASTGGLSANRVPLKIHENILVFYKSAGAYHPQKFRFQSSRLKIGEKDDGVLRDRSKSIYSCCKRVNWLETGKRYPLSIIFCDNVERNNRGFTRKSHPTQKPIALCEYLIKTYTSPGDLVLDNVIGSGTTAIAAYRTGRRWLGIEKDPEIFEKACVRIEQETRQQEMFVKTAV